MFDTFSTALSALNANSTAIKVTGDNLANLNTTGYKANRTDFHDLVSQVATENQQVGAGVFATTERTFTQGAFDPTGVALDAAIQGNGFFIVKDGSDATLFTRSGNFSVDQDGILRTSTGERVQGWPAANGTVSASGAVSDLTVPTSGLVPPVPTTELSVLMNLDETQAVGETFSLPFTAVDSLGEVHDLSVTFTRVNATDWDFDVTIPGEDLAAGTPGTPSSIATGTFTFGPDGFLDPATADVAIAATGLTNGASDLAINWSLFGPNSESLLTHFAQPSALSATNSNGSTAGELIDVRIADGGLVSARFTGGVDLVVGQLAVAGITNPESLIGVGNNNFRESPSTATPAVGAAGTGGRGLVRGGALESSTVDLAEEFTNLIRYQRSYQANSRMVTTEDEIIQETLSIKR